MMKSIYDWMVASNRWKHLLGGMALGALCDGLYAAALTGAAVGCAMEFKDRQWGGDWDWVDAGCTLAGALAGYGMRYGLAG